MTRRVREYARSIAALRIRSTTTVGRGCFLMSYVHLAHDCHLGDNIIISNGTQLAGHVTVEDRATISGLCAAHQFVRIGRTRSSADARACRRTCRRSCSAVGNPIKLFGLNSRRPAAQRIRRGRGARNSSARIGSASAPTSTCRRAWSGRAPSCEPLPEVSTSSSSSKQASAGSASELRRRSIRIARSRRQAHRASAWSGAGGLGRASCAHPARPRGRSFRRVRR